jgi:hypothetical protein
LRVQCNQFSIENEVSIERRERLNDAGEASVEHLLVARESRDLPPALHGNATIAVEFDFKGPLLARWQRRDRPALHRFNERKCYALSVFGKLISLKRSHYLWVGEIEASATRARFGCFIVDISSTAANAVSLDSFSGRI